MRTMSETLREALRKSTLTVYAVAKATGLQTDSLYRFLDGRTSLRLDLADRLAEFLGFELRKPAKRSTSGKGRGHGKHRQ